MRLQKEFELGNAASAGRSEGRGSTGAVELRGSDLSGVAVHIASRVMDTAGPAEVVVSRTVRDLTIGSQLDFVDRGEHTLKGVPGSWPLCAVA